MAKLTGQTIAASYDQLLIVGDADGITATAQAVESADTGGNASLLYLSTTEVYCPGPGGTSNTTFGKNAGDALDSGGNYNVFLGEEAGGAMVSGTNNIAIGYGAFDAADAGEDDCIAIGLNALGNLNNAASVKNIAIGSGAGDGMGTLGSLDNVFIGKDAGGGAWATAVSNSNVALGNTSMSGAMNACSDNTALGNYSLSAMTGGVSNVAVGYFAGYANETGDDNVIIGHEAGDGFTDVDLTVIIGKGAVTGTSVTAAADRTVAIGASALAALTIGAGNVAVGYYTLVLNEDGQYNTAVGYKALAANVDGDKNTAVGYQALESMEPAEDAGENTAVGYNAGDNITTGVNNTCIGSRARVGAADAINQIAIGNSVDGVDIDNSITIGGAAVTATYLASGAVDDNILHIGKASPSNGANADMSVGLTINQGATDNEAVAFKSSDVAHNVTTIQETDTYASFSKYSGAEGGLSIKGVSEGERPMALYGYGSSGDSTSNGIGVDKAHIQSLAFTNSGSGITNIGSAQVTWTHRVYKDNGSGSEVSTIVMFNEDGNIYADGSTSITGFDYAEYFEWKDGNPDNEDRVGYSVALDGDKIKKAEEGDAPIGIISARPGVIGDNPMGWHGKWKQDEWGRKIPKEVDWVKWEFEHDTGRNWKEGDEIPEGKNVGEPRILTKTRQWKVEDLPEDLEVPENAVYSKGMESQCSDDYDPSKTYSMRDSRQEWSAVGLMGKLRMRSGQPTASSWIKMRDEDNDIEMWLVK